MSHPESQKRLAILSNQAVKLEVLPVVEGDIFVESKGSYFVSISHDDQGGIVVSDVIDMGPRQNQSPLIIRISERLASRSVVTIVDTGGSVKIQGTDLCPVKFGNVTLQDAHIEADRVEFDGSRFRVLGQSGKASTLTGVVIKSKQIIETHSEISVDVVAVEEDFARPPLLFVVEGRALSLRTSGVDAETITRQSDHGIEIGQPLGLR